MNKIVVEQDELNIQDEELELVIKTNCITLNLSNQVYLKITSLLPQTTINLNLTSLANVEIDMVLLLKCHNLNIKIQNGENSKLNLNFATKYTGDNKLIIENNINTNNNDIKIRFRGVENNGSLDLLATGIIAKETKNNKYLEEIKVITNNCEKAKIMPDLIVDSNSVEANHNVTISSINSEYLFYLMSKGLEEKEATSLIKEGFLKSIIRKEEVNESA